jgi:hypothetical protein
MSFAMKGNRQEGKLLTVERKALKWAKANNAPPPPNPPKDYFDEFSYQMGWLSSCFHDYDDCKTKDTQMHRMHEQKGWVDWCPHFITQSFWNMTPFDIELKAFATSS